MNNKVLNVLLWIAQVALTGLFFMAGFGKVSTSVTEAAQQIPWATEVPELLFRFIGVSELAGAMGLLLPALLRIQPKLTPYAALGLIVVMILAAIFHLMRGEFPMIIGNLIISLLLFFVYWGRTKKAPIKAR